MAEKLATIISLVRNDVFELIPTYRIRVVGNDLLLAM